MGQFKSIGATAALIIYIGTPAHAALSTCAHLSTLKPPEPCYDIVTNDPAKPPKLGLNGDAIVQFQGQMSDKAADAQLRIDGSLLGIGPRVDSARRRLDFPLLRTDDQANRALWSRLLGSPFSHQSYEIPISLEIGGKPVPFDEGVTIPGNSPRAAINLVNYLPGFMALGLVFAAIVLLATICMCRYTTMIRDASITRLLLQDRPYSLGRLQMAFWFCIIFASVVFIATVTFDINSINAQSFILLGISAATALGSIAVDQSKNGDNGTVGKTQAAVAALGIASKTDVAKLNAAMSSAPNALATTIIPNASIPLLSAPSVKDLWKTYRALIEPVKSDGLLKDLVNDVNGPTLHRWQILIWTLLIGAYYVVQVYTTLTTPTFGANLLALMGISAGTYIGFKIPEKQPTK